MLPSRRILACAASSTSCSCAPDRPHARKRPGCQNRLCPRGLRALWEHLGRPTGRRNLGSCRVRPSEENRCGFRYRPEPKSSCLVGPDADPRRLGLVWVLLVRIGLDEGDVARLARRGGPHGDGAHPCPAKRRTGCCPGEERRGDAPGWEAWAAEWDAGSWPTVWGCPGWLEQLGLLGLAVQMEPGRPESSAASAQREPTALLGVLAWARPSFWAAYQRPRERGSARLEARVRAQAQGVGPGLQGPEAQEEV